MTCTSNVSNLCPNKIEPSCLTALTSLCGPPKPPADFMQCIKKHKDILENTQNKCYNLDKLQDCFYCSLLENVANAAGEPSLCEIPNLFGKESCLAMNLGAKCCNWTPLLPPPPPPPVDPPTNIYSATAPLLVGFVAIIIISLIVLIIWLIVRKKSKRS